jgi:hypothetical protein
MHECSRPARAPVTAFPLPVPHPTPSLPNSTRILPSSCPGNAGPITPIDEGAP